MRCLLMKSVSIITHFVTAAVRREHALWRQIKRQKKYEYLYYNECCVCVFHC